MSDAIAKNADRSAEAPDALTKGPWRVRSFAAGVVGSIVASFCCLPAATAIALGLSFGTVATLGQLLAYQRLFQLAGMAIAGVSIWWVLKRSRAECSLSVHEQDRVPYYVFGAFATSFLFLNLVVIPVLERLPQIVSSH